MVKKLFALASVTALTGLVAAVAASGCSSNEIEEADVPETGTPDVKAEAKAPVVIPEEETGPATCPTTTPITADDIGLTWVPPGPIQDVCTQENLDALKKLFDDGKGSAKYTDIEKTLGTTCAPCVFTPLKGTRWGMLVKDGANIVADNSSGACFGTLSDAACGKAQFELSMCLDIACPQADCTSQSACIGKAVKGACKTFATAGNSACPNAADLYPQCDNFVKIIAVSCGGGPDGGKDAS